MWGSQIKVKRQKPWAWQHNQRQILSRYWNIGCYSTNFLIEVRLTTIWFDKIALNHGRFAASFTNNSEILLILSYSEILLIFLPWMYHEWIFLFKEEIIQLAFTCLKSTIKTLVKAVNWRRYGVFTVNFEDISHLFVIFLLLTLNK